MTITQDRPTHVLDGVRQPEPLEDHTPRLPELAAPVEPARSGDVVPRGWGSSVERRMTLQALGFFAVLGLYATVFVLLGALVWT